MKRAGHYFVAQIATKAVAFIAVPVFTHFLTPAEYGLYSVFLSYVSIGVVVFTLNSYAAVSRYYYSNDGDFDSFLGTTVLITLAIYLILGLAFMAFSRSFSIILSLPQTATLFIVPSVLFMIASSLFEQVNQPQRNSKKIAVRTVVQAYVQFAMSVLLIFLLRTNKYMGLIIAQQVIGAVFLLFYIIDLRPYIKFQIKKVHIKYIFAYTLPLIPYMLSSVILQQFSRIVINTNLGATQSGLYSLAANIGSIMYMITTSLFSAWLPDFFELCEKRDTGTLQKRTERLFLFIGFLAMGLILWGEEMGMVLSDARFASAFSIIPVIVLGYVFEALFSCFAWYVAFSRRTFFSSLIVLLAGLINIVANRILISVYGVRAGAYATLIGYIAEFLIGWLVVKMVMRLETIRILPLLKCLPGTFLALAIALFSANLSVIPHYAIKAAASLVACGIYAFIELPTIKAFWKRATP
jgi:O-antigen/teichoic acid export membrane protein